MYKNVHSAIRENPNVLPKEQSKKKKKYTKKSKKSYAERRDHILNKILSRKRHLTKIK